jgi:uncharacterized membrane protein (DUF106 family)
MSILNLLFGGALEAALWPFQRLSPVFGLAFVALLTAVAVLLVYRRTSDQAGISSVRRRIVASLLEMRLFRDDLVVVFRAQGRVLKDSLRYFRYSLAPLAWILVPLVVLFIHLDRVYGYAPLAPGEATIVTVGAQDVTSLTLEAGPGLAVETLPLRIPGAHEVHWRVRGLIHGEHALTVRTPDHASTKRVTVGSGRATLAPTRPSSGIIDQLLHPGETPIPSDAPVQGITVHYRRATVSFLGWHVHWVIPFLVLTIVFGFAMQKPLGVKL